MSPMRHTLAHRRRRVATHGAPFKDEVKCLASHGLTHRALPCPAHGRSAVDVRVPHGRRDSDSTTADHSRGSVPRWSDLLAGAPFKVDQQCQPSVSRKHTGPFDDERLRTRVEVALTKRRGIDSVEELAWFTPWVACSTWLAPLSTFEPTDSLESHVLPAEHFDLKRHRSGVRIVRLGPVHRAGLRVADVLAGLRTAAHSQQLRS